MTFDTGFDGVERHGANGDLIHQFLSPPLNRRNDDCDGSPDARARLLRETVAVVDEATPLTRVGLSVSPFADDNNVRDPDLDQNCQPLARFSRCRPFSAAARKR